jgi:3-oxoacyl-[acyl-carrier protein] reductase
VSTVAAPDGGARWTIVSGANGSLGREIVDHFLAAGRPVLALDRIDDRFAAAALPRGLTMRTLDLASEAEVAAALDAAIPRSDRIELLVNAVGLIWNEPIVAVQGAKFRSHSADSWRQVIEANLTAPFVLAAQVAARMARKGGGAIVNFSSVCGRGNGGQAAYSAAKAGVEGLTRAMAMELGPLGIRVNAIAPGFFAVDSTRAALSGGQLDALIGRTPLRRLGSVAELLSAIDFLAESGFTTGAVLDINGGVRL